MPWWHQLLGNSQVLNSAPREVDDNDPVNDKQERYQQSGRRIKDIYAEARLGS